jgi:fatty acid desaturase
VTWTRFFGAEAGRILRCEGSRRGIWLRHAFLVGAFLWLLGRAGMPIDEYVLCFVFPGTSLTLLRSFAEHRPADDRSGRTVVVEAGWPFSLLFLNNNLHVVHHEQPWLPWFELERAYRERPKHSLDGVVKGGYAALWWRFGLRPVRSPVVS